MIHLSSLLIHLPTSFPKKKKGEKKEKKKLVIWCDGLRLGSKMTRPRSTKSYYKFVADKSLSHRIELLPITHSIVKMNSPSTSIWKSLKGLQFGYFVNVQISVIWNNRELWSWDKALVILWQNHEFGVSKGLIFNLFNMLFPYLKSYRTIPSINIYIIIHYPLCKILIENTNRVLILIWYSSSWSLPNSYMGSTDLTICR